ncbi:hypothetical protein, partial [Kingella kingae]
VIEADGSHAPITQYQYDENRSAYYEYV